MLYDLDRHILCPKLVRFKLIIIFLDHSCVIKWNILLNFTKVTFFQTNCDTTNWWIFRFNKRDVSTMYFIIFWNIIYLKWVASIKNLVHCYLCLWCIFNYNGNLREIHIMLLVYTFFPSNSPKEVYGLFLSKIIGFAGTKTIFISVSRNIARISSSVNK